MKAVETERKFIIKKPNEKTLSSLFGYTVSKITQTYLASREGVTERVRERIYPDKTVYTHTKKVRISPLSSIEDEREVTESEYRTLLLRKKDGTQDVKKERHTFIASGVTFEIDIYPEWQDTCIMEFELKSEDERVEIPTFIAVVREVTGNRAYSNAAMAKEFPKEV